MATSEASIVINGNLLSLSKPSSADARYTKYLYIRGTGPFSPTQKEQLDREGVTLLEYLGKVNSRVSPLVFDIGPALTT